MAYRSPNAINLEDREDRPPSEFGMCEYLFENELVAHGWNAHKAGWMLWDYEMGIPLHRVIFDEEVDAMISSTSARGRCSITWFKADEPSFGKLNYRLLGCRTHIRFSRPEAGEFAALFEVSDPVSNEQGRFYYVVEWDKRDCEFEGVWTDNEKLVVKDDEPPSCYNAFRVRDDFGADPTKNDCNTDVWMAYHTQRFSQRSADMGN